MSSPTPSLPASIREALREYGEAVGMRAIRVTPESWAREEKARAALEADLLTLIADAERLDWLDAVRDGDLDIGTTHLDAIARIRWRDGLRPREHTGQTLREAIDAARTPPEDTTPHG